MFDPVTRTGPSWTGALAAFLILVVVLLVAVMVTGYNNSIPGLHPVAGTTVTVAGDRQTVSYLFAKNGTWTNVTQGDLCAGCPLTVSSGSRFYYPLMIANTLNASFEVTGISALLPFHLPLTSPALPVVIVPGFSQLFNLTVTSPTTAGTYALSISIAATVS